MGADTKDTGQTPPALTAAQMALVQTLADVLHNQKTGEACQALLSDWFELRAENTELRARIEALERERDAAVASRMSDHGILLDAWRDRGEAVPGVDRESTVLRVIRGIHAMRDRAEQAESALTAATARLSEVTNEWESCLERDRAHRDEVREYQARLTEVERERDTARKDAEEWRTTELERTIAQARQDLANLDADLSAERLGREEDIKCADRALTAAQARIEALEGRELALRRAINDYRAGIMALNPALSAALVAHLPEPQGGDSEF